jgi:hypothetical protein
LCNKAIWSNKLNHQLENDFPEFFTPQPDLLAGPEKGKNYYTWALLYKFLAPHYIPDHQAMLDAVHQLQADP